MSAEHEARTPEGEEAVEAASSSPEVLDAEVVEEEILDAEVVDGVHGAVADASPPEPAAAQPAAGAEGDAAAADPLTEALRERDEYLDLAQRTRADFENFKRRAAAQAAEGESRARTAMARNLLPAIDNLERALAAAGAGAADDDGLAKGFALVHDELRSALERSGVNAYDPAGSKFDPTLHEAISTAPADGVEPGTVLETLELGYRAGDQVIRPARVVVSG